MYDVLESFFDCRMVKPEPRGKKANNEEEQTTSMQSLIERRAVSLKNDGNDGNDGNEGASENKDDDVQDGSGPEVSTIGLINLIRFSQHAIVFMHWNHHRHNNRDRNVGMECLPYIYSIFF